jgi:hypothetical protein
MKFTNANKLHRKSGGMGHPSFARNHGHGLTKVVPLIKRTDML